MRSIHPLCGSLIPCVTGALLAISLASPAHAIYQGLSVIKFTTVNIGGTNRDVYRVYANFDNAADACHGAYGSPTVGALTIQSRNLDDSAPGSNFVNVLGGTNQAPTAAAIGQDPNVEWDSFYTIGISIAEQAPFGDQISFPPGSPPALAGNSVTTSNGGWLTLPTIDHDQNPNTPDIVNPQSLAGFIGDGDPLLRVLLLQLTVSAGDNVRGTMNVLVRDAGAGTGYTEEQQVFNSVPGPGGLALLGLTMVMSKRRRR